MNTPLKLIKIGNSTGVILPDDVLAHLRVQLGDEVLVCKTPHAVSLSAYDPDLAEAMIAAEEIMQEDRDVLAVLAR